MAGVNIDQNNRLFSWLSHKCVSKLSPDTAIHEPDSSSSASSSASSSSSSSASTTTGTDSDAAAYANQLRPDNEQHHNKQVVATVYQAVFEFARVEKKWHITQDLGACQTFKLRVSRTKAPTQQGPGHAHTDTTRHAKLSSLSCYTVQVSGFKVSPYASHDSDDSEDVCGIAKGKDSQALNLGVDDKIALTFHVDAFGNFMDISNAQELQQFYSKLLQDALKKQEFAEHATSIDVNGASEQSCHDKKSSVPATGPGPGPGPSPLASLLDMPGVKQSIELRAREMVEQAASRCRRLWRNVASSFMSLPRTIAEMKQQCVLQQPDDAFRTPSGHRYIPVQFVMDLAPDMDTLLDEHYESWLQSRAKQKRTKTQSEDESSTRQEAKATASVLQQPELNYTYAVHNQVVRGLVDDKTLAPEHITTMETQVVEFDEILPDASTTHHQTGRTRLDMYSFFWHNADDGAQPLQPKQVEELWKARYEKFYDECLSCFQSATVQPRK
jgi:hypothetical protein